MHLLQGYVENNYIYTYFVLHSFYAEAIILVEAVCLHVSAYSKESSNQHRSDISDFKSPETSSQKQQCLTSYSADILLWDCRHRSTKAYSHSRNKCTAMSFFFRVALKAQLQLLQFLDVPCDIASLHFWVQIHFRSPMCSMKHVQCYIYSMTDGLNYDMKAFLAVHVGGVWKYCISCGQDIKYDFCCCYMIWFVLCDWNWIMGSLPFFSLCSIFQFHLFIWLFFTVNCNACFI